MNSTLLATVLLLASAAVNQTALDDDSSEPAQPAGVGPPVAAAPVNDERHQALMRWQYFQELRHDALHPASTADAFCPTLRGRVESRLDPRTNYALEIVLDGTDEDAIRAAMSAGIHASAAPDVVAISAGNYGGKLGKFHFHLRELLAQPEA